MSTQVQALVVGAGISGLAVAYALKRSGITTLVFEASTRPGGVIQTIHREGFLSECGPQSFSGNANLDAICEELDLLEQRVFADSKAPRYILLDGKLRQFPMGPGLLASPFLGGGTRFALIRDVLSSTHPPDSDESIAAFIRRKFSPALLERLIGPFVSGIYAGDPEKLSLRAAFPILYEAETQKGSVVRGLLSEIKKRREKTENASQPKSTLQSFHDGNETLIRALVKDIGERLYCNTEVVAIDPLDPGHEANAPRFHVTLHTQRGEERIETERLILTVPPDVAGKILSRMNPGFASEFAAIPFAPVAAVSLGYRQSDVGNDLNGFGFLVPRSSGLNILGTVWNSSLFPNRAPAGYVLLTSFLGGATNPEITQKPAEELAAITQKENSPLLSIRNQPMFSNVTVWPRALPQYNVGHQARLAAIEKLRAGFPGLHFAGNYLHGPALGACVDQGFKVANEIRISFAN